MKRTNKKGFTIVELVIVIAVIAILAAVLIPTFASIIKKANVSKDTQLVRNLNTALAANTVEEKTMTQALAAAADFGYDLGKINASATGNEILWDSVNNVFCYLNNGAPEYIPEFPGAAAVENYQLWKIYNKDEAIANNSYSAYVGPNYTLPANGEISVENIGIDAGERTDITKINYSGDQGYKVVIRTNGGTLIVNDTDNAAEQAFYGYADSVEVTTGSACFTAHGTIGTMDLKAGKAVAASGAYVGLVKAASGTVAEEDGGLFVIPANVEASDIQGTVSGYTIGETIVASEEKAALVEKASEEFAKQASEDDSTVAIIGSKKYNSLNEAVANANPGEVIYLVGNVELSADIGDYDVTSTNDLVFDDDCLKNEIKLLKDVTMTFAGTGTRNIWLQAGGSINPNGHTLTLVGGAVSATINYTAASGDFSSTTITFTSPIAYAAPTSGVLGSALSYTYQNNNGAWAWGETSFFFAGGAPVVGPGDPPPLW